MPNISVSSCLQDARWSRCFCIFSTSSGDFGLSTHTYLPFCFINIFYPKDKRTTNITEVMISTSDVSCCKIWIAGLYQTTRLSQVSTLAVCHFLADPLAHLAFFYSVQHLTLVWSQKKNPNSLRRGMSLGMGNCWQLESRFLADCLQLHIPRLKILGLLLLFVPWLPHQTILL